MQTTTIPTRDGLPETPPFTTHLVLELHDPHIIVHFIHGSVHIARQMLSVMSVVASALPLMVRRWASVSLVVAFLFPWTRPIPACMSCHFVPHALEVVTGVLCLGLSLTRLGSVGGEVTLRSLLSAPDRPSNGLGLSISARLLTTQS